MIAKTQSPPREAFTVPSAPSTRLLILQPTPFCNLDCDYCYLPNRDDTRRMSIATVRLAAQRLVDDGLAGLVRYGASPRGLQALIRGARPRPRA